MRLLFAALFCDFFSLAITGSVRSHLLKEPVRCLQKISLFAAVALIVPKKSQFESSFNKYAT
jgi:hypothetical protein